MKVGIVGAGAAGLMAATSILEKHPSAEVMLFERNNRVGRKVAISGGGRCNVTTGITDPKILKSKYPRGAEFLKFAFKVFPPEKVVEWFEDHGVKLKCEPDMRVFPASNNSEEIVELFEKLIPQTFKLGESVLNIEKSESGFLVTTNQSSYQVDKLILTTGGNAYSHTGSKGDGYSFAAALGHTITDLGPSLNSFELEDTWAKELSGLSLPSATLKYQNLSATGPFLFTHFGISGPVTFAFASLIPFTKINREHPLQVQLIIQISSINSQKDLNDLIAKNGKKQVSNLFTGLIPERLSRTIFAELGINTNKNSADLTKLERQNLANFINNGINLKFINRRPGDEFVTAGGVDLAEVNPKNMQSKLVPDLFFAGELLNVDGYTGGFNLQASWATGRLAGLNI